MMVGHWDVKMAVQMAAKTIDLRACVRVEEKCSKKVEQKLN